MALRDLITFGLGPAVATYPTVGEIADAVWNEARVGHVAAGSFGAVSEWASTGGLTAQQTRDAMKLAPSSGAPAAGSVDKHLDDWGNPTVSISSTVAAGVASGALAIETFSTFSQAITSDSTAALNTATKVWLVIKVDRDDLDSAAVAFIEASGGLTVLAQAAYTSTTHGTLVVSGSSGAWVITPGLVPTATALLTGYVDRTYKAAVKALVAGATVAVWDGQVEITQGIARVIA